MEVVGGVASAITVVTLALQSTKIIYELANSISHGSAHINRLATATSDLEKFLEATKRLAEQSERTNSVADGRLLEKMTPLLERCANDLGEIARKLTQLQKDPTDPRWKKAKKHAKVYLDTKGVTEIWNTVNHYVELLGSYLSNASVDVGLHNAQKLRVLHDELSAASRDNRSQLSHVEEGIRDQRVLAQALQAEMRQESLDARAAASTQIQGIAEVKTWQQQWEKATGNRYDDIHTNFQDIRAIINDRSHQATIRSKALMTEVREGIAQATSTSSAQHEEIRRMNTEITPRVLSISDRLEDLHSMSSEQQSTLQSLAKMLIDMQLGTRTGREKSRTSTTTEASLPEHNRRNDLETSLDSGFKKIFATLSHFAGKMTACSYSKEAQSVIEDIGGLLGMVMEQMSATGPSRDDLPRKRKIMCDYHYSELETAIQSMENLRKAKRVLTASQRVQISNQDTRQIDEGDQSALLQPKYAPNSPPKDFRRRSIPNANLQSIVRSWTLRHGRLDAIFRTVPFPDGKDQDGENVDEEFAAKLLLTPTSARVSNFQIVVDIAAKISPSRTICLTPMLTFRAIIPDYSKVFRVVERGSVKKLKKLISSGGASLGDCDSMGRSLLNFALWGCRRKMTRFLIQSGADVDTLEPGNRENYFHPIAHNPVKPFDMIRRIIDSESADKDVERVEGCFKLLIDAGSDLSSAHMKEFPEMRNPDDSFISVFPETLINGALTKLKALIDLGEPFISLEYIDENQPYENVPLLLLGCIHSSAYRSNFQMADKIALLLSRGVNVKARGFQGRTCLHHVFSGDKGYGRAARQWRHQCRTKDIAILMISAGADVCAIDDWGWSVSDVAISTGQQDLWTEALKFCGIDIKDVLARPNVDPAQSTALSSEYSEPPMSVTTKVSLEEYLQRRKAFRVPEEKELKSRDSRIDSSEDDDSEDDDSGDEDFNPESFSSEGDESKDKVLANEASEFSEVEGREHDDENHGIHFRYEGGIGKGKAKLD